jgi:single-strand DNA-binding protein
MNNWNFTGSLGQDCKVATTQNGKTVCEFSVAVNSGYGDNKKTTWANCVMFGKRAEGQLPGYLAKGQKVAVSGEMTLETWETNGVKGAKVKVFVSSIDLIGEKKAEQQAPQQQSAPQQYQQQAPQQAPQQQAPDNFDGKIPF